MCAHFLFPQFQRERMSMFCRQNFISRERKYPEGGALDAFHRHLMFDDAHKVIFCFVPKVSLQMYYNTLQMHTHVYPIHTVMCKMYNCYLPISVIVFIVRPVVT